MELEKIKNYLDNFIEERKWNQHRTPKNLCMALIVEVAELVELFQWMDTEESLKIKEDPRTLQSVREELADILSYLVQISSVLDIDLIDAFWKKTYKIEKKHPVKAIRISSEI